MFIKRSILHSTFDIIRRKRLQIVSMYQNVKAYSTSNAGRTTTGTPPPDHVVRSSGGISSRPIVDQQVDHTPTLASTSASIHTTPLILPPIFVDSSPQPLIKPELARFLCGGLAGIVSRTATAPIDRVKVMRQVGVADYAGRNMLQGIKRMIAEGGIVSLWRGNGVNIMKNCPESALRFGMHGWLKSLLFPETNNGSTLNPFQRLLVASLAGATSLTLTYPAEIMKTRMALRSSSDPHSMWHHLCILYRQGGLRGFFRGYLISMSSYVPYSGMELALYELLKREYLRLSSAGQSSNSQSLLPAYVAIPIIITSSIIPIMIVYPANLLRTQFQASDSPRAAPFLASLHRIYQSHGYRGLYRGMAASLSKTLPSVCITYLVFERATSLLRVPGLGAR